ncbi:MAG: 2-amino-4-hydroxy-6-hydroxymethyldihydropteridine diphosphokinase, partial [Muribaculaceae bacterium]|nr:2-amino-4-hydroxy-6-hydroxymethyldihydropteridine diphosphokinase [Muribaculaceae bacterium]
MSHPSSAAALTEVILCLGCNTPESESRIHEAVEFLRQFAAPETLIATPVYHCDNSSYGNALVLFSTPLSIPELTIRTKDYESRCGRTPESKRRGIIEMDIDLVIANG